LAIFVSSTKNSDQVSKSAGATKIGLALWFVSLSYFIVYNYKVGPAIPITLSKKIWVLIHAISNTLFSGGVILSTILEWFVVSEKNPPEVLHYWFTQQVSNIDKIVVLPALTISILAGFAQTALDYGSMATAPQHIRRAIHILATFAMWWGATDLTTQRAAKKSVQDWYDDAITNNKSAGNPIPKVLYFRRWSNVVSCLFVAALYGLMALKPEYRP